MPAPVATPNEEAQAEVGGRTVQLPAVQPHFESERSARAHLLDLGFEDVSAFVGVDPGELAAALSRACRGAKFLDGTEKLAARAGGLNGRFDALYDLVYEAQRGEGTTVFVCRSDVRTAFLGGLFYMKCFQHGSPAAASAAVRAQGAAPGALVVNSQVAVEVPNFALRSSVASAARAIEGLMGGKELDCVACTTPVAELGCVRPFLSQACGHVVHAACAKVAIALNRPRCDACGEPFPVAELDDPFRSQTHERINALAAAVRHAAVLDGREVPESCDFVRDPCTPSPVADVGAGPEDEAACGACGA
jgi:hypothetical protein